MTVQTEAKHCDVCNGSGHLEEFIRSRVTDERVTFYSGKCPFCGGKGYV